MSGFGSDHMEDNFTEQSLAALQAGAHQRQWEASRISRSELEQAQASEIELKWKGSLLYET